jgi:hypothetical protein
MENIIRCPHDAQNPYTMIRTEINRDSSISPACRWLITYLLSNKESFVINIKQIINHIKPFMGRDKVYKIVNEAINAGYICREELKRPNPKGGMLKYYNYIISEIPKFKKFYRCTDDQYPGKTYAKEIPISNKIEKEKNYKKEKEVKEESMHIHGCISLPHSLYDDAVKKHTKPFIDHIIDRMDTYYSTHPDRAQKQGCYASKLQFWIRNELKNKQRKKQSEELAFRQKEEEDRKFQIQQEQIQADKEKKRIEQQKAFVEKVQANRPIVEKYIEKYPGIVRISGMIWNGICEIVDKAHQIHTVFFTQDDFEAQIRSQLMKNGYLCT